MVSTFTPNVGIEEPARGDYVGTWDTPVNNNMTLIDLVLGGRTTINGAAGDVILAAAQYQCNTITINSTLLASITVTFPTSFTKPYYIRNLCTGSSVYTVTLQTTAGGQAICAPPGDTVEIINDGSNLFFANLGRIGSYWDYAGSSVPKWVSGCTVPPYLHANGATFSSATYPQLATILGSTTLPDTQGRTRFALDGGTGRLSSAVAGFNPNSVGSAGGSQNYQQHSHTIFITDPGHTHTLNNATNLLDNLVGNNFQGSNFIGNARNVTVNTAVTGITATSSNSGTGTAGNVPPAYIGGITLIRAA